MTTSGSSATVDMRRAPLLAIRGLDLRSRDRDLWADERAIWDRFVASWAGLDDAAWRLAGAAPSDAGGPDWSLLDHVAHTAHWQEIAIGYVAEAERTGRWPSDEDFDGGDFDRYNERMRTPWEGLPPSEVRARLTAGHDRLVEVVRQLDPTVVRSDEAWGWIFMTLHGHQLDHLGIIEPWAERLRERQAGHDPFVTDPRPAPGEDALAAFLAAEASVMTLWQDLVAGVPIERWTESPVTPGWTLRDHVAHLADWNAEGAAAIEEHLRGGPWPDGPEEGFDAWNERALERHRDEPPTAVLERFTASRQRLLQLVAQLPPGTLLGEDGWSWTYECLHGHVRSHLAMVGPWCARLDWPPADPA
jgi:hypothetical protein